MLISTLGGQAMAAAKLEANPVLAQLDADVFHLLLQAKLSQLGRLEERLDLKLAIAAELPGQFEGLAKQQAAGGYVVEGLRKDIKVGLTRCGGRLLCCPCTASA
jgi:hypothetical protein